MSKNSKRSRLGSNAAAGDGGSVTVVDGNAVGVAPSGDAAATVESNDDAAVAEILDAADVPAEPATDAADELDPEILALLGDESTPLPTEPVADPVTAENDAAPETTEGDDSGVETVASEETEIEVDVEIEEADEEAILAELEDADPAAATTPAAAPTTRKKREPKAAPTVTRQFADIAAIDPAAFKTNLDGSTAKKVNEKVQNLIQAVETGKKLSNYTALAVKHLVAEGKVSGKSLAEMFQANNLSKGTAAAQAQQMTALFKIAGIATPSNDNARELILADEGLARELVSLAG